MSRPGFRYHQQSVPEFLRNLADEIEARDNGGEGEPTEVAIVVHGTLGGIFWVDGNGQAGSIEALGVLRLGDQILTNALTGKE